VGERTTLLELYELLRRGLSATSPEVESLRPAFGPTRPGDVPHSLADITLARTQLGYEPTHTVAQGLEAALPWYVHSLAPAQTT
jgi:UDP-N-acetylglucosamine 4-epimerase